MKDKFLILLFISSCFILHSQEVRRLSIKDAVKIALSNSEELKNLELDVQIQHAKNNEIVASAYPQISASGQMNYYFSLPQIQFPSSNFGIYEVLAKEGVKDGNGNPIDINKATFGVNNISFFAPLNMQAGISINQLLFQPDVFVGLKAREEVLNFAKANTRVAEEKVKEAVKKAYYQVLIAEKQKLVLEETLKRLKLLTSQMEQMFKQGFVEKLDIDKLQVSINNTQSAINQVDNGIRLSKSALKSTLGLPLTDSLILTEQLDLNELKSLLMVDEVSFKYEDRKEIGLLNIAKKLEDLNMERSKKSTYPTIAFFLNYSRNGQRNANFNPQDPWLFYSTGITGLSISQPIFNGNLRKHKMEQSRLSSLKIDNSINQIKRYIDLEQNLAKTSLKNAIINLEIQERNMKLAQSVFETTQKKYAAGVGSSFELIQADTELQRASGAYFQAMYDGYLAKTAWDKAIGKL